MFHLPVLSLKSFLLFFSFFIVVFGNCKLETWGKPNGEGGKDITLSGLALPPTSGKKPDSIVIQ